MGTGRRHIVVAFLEVLFNVAGEFHAIKGFICKQCNSPQVADGPSSKGKLSHDTNKKLVFDVISTPTHKFPNDLSPIPLSVVIGRHASATLEALFSGQDLFKRHSPASVADCETSPYIRNVLHIKHSSQCVVVVSIEQHLPQARQ
eukprot:1652116-Pleurochrysis_carterae.AAC.2